MDASERRFDGSAPSTPRSDVLAAVHRTLDIGRPSTPTPSVGSSGIAESNRYHTNGRSQKKVTREGDREPGRVLAMLEKRLDSERPRILLEPRLRDRTFSSIASE